MPLYYIPYNIYSYKSNTFYKYETGKMRFELTDREYLYGRIAIDFTLPTDDLPNVLNPFFIYRQQRHKLYLPMYNVLLL